MKKLELLLCSLLLLILVSCEEENNDPQVDPEPDLADVIVACEGAFQGNNASLSLYTSDSEEVQNGIFEAVNGYGPGDVLQSITRIGDHIYLLLNNSSKIEVVQATSLVSEAVIQGLVSPREILAVSTEKAYVSNLFTNSIQIVDLSDHSLSGGVDIGGWSEGMLITDGKVYVARSSDDQVMVIDPVTDMLIDSITVTPGPVNMRLDEEGMIWLATNGNFGAVDPKVHRIDPVTDEVILTVDIPAPYSYSIELDINADGDQVYLLNNEVYTMFIGDNSLSDDPIAEGAGSFYGMAIHPSSGDIYATDAGDFASPGTVYRYSMSGVLMDEFQVGIAPNGFLFRN
ncbi:MAG: hypothetical protein HKN79_01920 [Flavobacteriales bacterium]|nr:hypothetical protein [Flavobacteriales bacterium]